MRYRAQAMVSAAAAPAVGQDRRGVVEIQTGFGADAPAMVYEVDGDEYIAIVTGGNSPQGSANGDALWAFSLKGPLTPLYRRRAGRSQPASTRSGSPISTPNTPISGAHQGQGRTAVTFTNLGNLPHTATAAAADTGKWDTGLLNHGQSKTVTFTELGIHYFICTTHPWMYGAVIVKK
jgi:alcohol dehydrogenase (cytochrome c)